MELIFIYGSEINVKNKEFLNIERHVLLQIHQAYHYIDLLNFKNGRD